MNEHNITIVGMTAIHAWSHSKNPNIIISFCTFRLFSDAYSTAFAKNPGVLRSLFFSYEKLST